MELLEKQRLIQTILNMQDYDPDLELSDVENWDSLTMMNLQMELSMYRDEITLEEIQSCKILSDLEQLID